MPLILGVILNFYSGIQIHSEVLLLLVFVLIVLMFPAISRKGGSTNFFTIVYSLLFVSLGIHLSSISNSLNNEHYFTYESQGQNNYLVRVVDPPEEKDRSIKCVVEVLKVNESNCMGRSLIYFQKDSAALNLKYGDQIYFKSTFNSIRSNGNPKEFDYARYLRIHDIHHQSYVKTGNWQLISNDANPILSSVFGLRKFLSGKITNSGMSAKNAMVANALILGQKEYLDKDVLRSYSSAGAMHVLAVSGLHVGIIMLILTTLFNPLKKFRHGKNLFLLAVLGGIWFYAVITGLSPSVLRAAVMFTFIVIGKELERDTTVYQSILVSAFLLILIEPFIIFQVGFQLSYLAVLGIVYLQPRIENLIYIKNKLLFKAWQISAVSIAAQIATFPLGLYYFHQFPNFFLLSNLLVIPLAFFILIIGIAYLVFHAVPFLSDLLLWVFDGMITVLNFGVEWVEKLPYSILWGISIHWYEVFLLYLSILLGSIAFIYRKTKALIVSMIVAILLLILNIHEKYQLSSENVLYIYNVNDELAIDLFYGRQNIFISSEEFLNEEEKLLFHVKHNWFYRTGNEQPAKWYNSEEIRYLKFGGNTMALLNETDCSKSKMPVADHILIHDISFIDKHVLEQWNQQKIKLIYGCKVKSSVKRFISKNFSDIEVYDLSTQGAYELYF